MRKKGINLGVKNTNDPKSLKEINNNLSSEPELLKNIFNNIPASLYCKDKNGVYLACNLYQAKMAGLNDVNSFIGKTDYDFPWKDYADELTIIDRKVMRSKIPLELEETPTLADGRKITMITRKAPLHDKDGNVIGIIGVSVDVTDRKKGENDALAKHRHQEMTLEKIIELMPGSVYWVSTEGVYLGCNNNVLKTLGLKSKDDYVGKNNFDFLDRESAEKIKVIDDAIIKNNMPVILEEEGKNEKGEKAIYLTHKNILRNNNGEVIGLLGVSLDITERKHMEQDLNEAKEGAELVNKLKSDFILNMEHDIRTPASGISHMVDMLVEQETNAEKREILTCLAKASKQLYHLLNDIITFNKVINIKTPVLAKPFKLSKLIDNIMQLELPAAKMKDIEVILQYQENMPKIFISDEFRISRILLNLISNAVKFTNKGLVKVSVKLAKQIDAHNILLSIAIKDTGIGISEEKINFIYQDFSRGELSRQSKFRGAGLGLKIVKSFVDDLEAEIFVKSEIEKGTVFTVMLPLKISIINNSIDEEVL